MNDIFKWPEVASSIAPKIDNLFNVLNAIAFFYAPLTYARVNSDAIDTFYHGYRILLGPWLSGL